MTEDKPAEAEKPRRRKYEKILKQLDDRQKRHPIERSRLMHNIVEALWESFANEPYAWCGFYCPTPDASQLILGSCRDVPACSPIGTHGVCGKALSTRTTQIIDDVKKLGSAYIECDPSHQSEIAVPVMNDDGEVFAILDIDSKQPAAFNDEDRRWLERIVKVLRETKAPTA